MCNNISFSLSELGVPQREGGVTDVLVKEIELSSNG